MRSTIKAFVPALFALLLISSASAQEKLSKQQLVGTWTYVSVVNTLPDGTKFDPNGGHGTGILMFDSSGRFSWHLIRSDIPNYASNNRLKGTPEEYKAAAEGTLSYFGTYELDPSGKFITMNIASSSFPNFRGQSSKRDIALKGNELVFVNPGGASGGSAMTTWKRAK